MNSRILVIIVTFNGEKWIDRCLSSVDESKTRADVVVVDNASEDQTVSIIQQKFAFVKLIVNRKNLGFSAGNNIGIRYGLGHKYDYFFLLNQDTWVAEDTLTMLLNCCDDNQKYGLLSPVHKAYNNIGLEYYYENYILKEHIIFDNKRVEEINLLPCNFVNAAAWFMPRSTIEKVGGFDSLFEHTGEDNDYFQRLSFWRLEAAICTRAFIGHAGTNENLINGKLPIKMWKNTVLLKLKKPQASLAGALFLFLKGNLKNIFFPALTWKKVSLKKRIELLSFGIKKLPQILKSRRTQKKTKAYL